MLPLTQASIPQALQLARQQFVDGHLNQAESICHQILSIEPAEPMALHLLGVLKLRTNLPIEAEQWLRQAEEANPNDPVVKTDLANSLMMQKQLEPAIVIYRAALALNPNDGLAQCNLGIALNETGEPEESIACFERAIALAPDLAPAHNNLGHALRKLGRLTEAMAALRKAVALRPNWADIHNSIASVHRDSGQIELAIAEARQVIQLNPRSASGHSRLLMLMHYDPNCDAKTMFDEHRRWDQVQARSIGGYPPPHRNDRSPQRRLRIGYVSPDMRDHAVSYFFEPLLATHDAAQIQSFCYADVQKPDAVTARLRHQAHEWRDIYGMSHQQLASTIREDQIDILVDLSGHTAGNRLLTFALQPAPIAVTYLGYPDTTGLRAIDYRLTDAWSDPMGMTEAFHSEQLVRLPDTFLCYRPSTDAPEVSALPAKSTSRITFGSFNILPKINARLVSLWAELLRRCPGSKMLLKTGSLENKIASSRLLELFAAAGIGPERLDLHERSPTYIEHLKLYDQVDIALDSFPYHGTTTSCEAMWMGAPLVTLAGRTHVSRVGVSLLNNVGLPQLIAEGPEEYVRMAAALAGDLARLSELRASMRERMRRSPLMDAKRLAAGIEEAYRTMWRHWSDSCS